jgi:hypothetical protein
VQSEELTTAEECSLTPQMVTDKAAFFLLMWNNTGFFILHSPNYNWLLLCLPIKHL